MSIQDNVRRILDSVPAGITVVAAVKYADKGQVLETYAAGIRNFGFNTLRQAEEITPHLPPDAKIHYIGTLQKNKVKKLITLRPTLIQSVDTKDLAEKIDRESEKAGIIQDILIQVNTDPEKKAGIPKENLHTFIHETSCLKNIRIRGLMTIPPQAPDPEDARTCFKNMHTLFREQKQETKTITILSMGMSSDYSMAIEEGATMIRPGRTIFSGT